MASRLTDRDHEILELLSASVRLFSLQQIAETWWPGTRNPRALADDRMRDLARAGWIERYSALYRPLPEILNPVACWRPGCERPNSGRIAWQVQSRWKSGPRKRDVIVATNRTTKSRSGRTARKIKQYFQLTHDIGVSQTYLRFRFTRPKEALRWYGEAIIAPLRKKKKVPDAVIAGDSIWPPRLVVEFAGSYSRQRIDAFHWFCEKEQLPYELW